MKKPSGLFVPSYPEIIAFKDGSIMLPSSTGKMPNGGIRTYKTTRTFGTRKRASKTARHEHMAVYSKKFGNLKVHILVCEAFHGPKPFPEAVVIHIDENSLNNWWTNLKWGTQKENLNMPKYLAYCRSRTGDLSPARKGFLKKASLSSTTEADSN